MMAFAVLLLSVSPTVRHEATERDRELLARAEQFFAEGVARWSDERVARDAFARSATLYDELWAHGNRSPELALNRAHSHRLGGSLPHAIAALNEGLAQARWSRPLQNALEDARAAVGYPQGSDLAALCRPTPSRTIGTRLSPLDDCLIAGSLWFAAWLGAARYAMTRKGSWLILGTLSAGALAAFAAAWVLDDRTRHRDSALPVVVVDRDVLMRKGNGESYPARLEGRPELPAGVEARLLTSRGGWLQIRLAGGAIGWIPESAALKSAG